MTRILCAAALAVCAATAAPADPLTARQHEVFSATCTHFGNRVETAPSEVDTTLLAALAESCAIALSDLSEASDSDDEAATYLERLSAFKATVVGMNVKRVFGGGAKTPVSATGEYLIARRMGLLGAYRAYASAADIRMAGID